MYPTLEITSTCIACGDCELICPENAILSDGNNYSIDDWSCTQCHLCVHICSSKSIRKVEDNLARD